MTTPLPKSGHMTTGEAIVRSLRHHDVDTIFGIPGAHMYDFNDAIAREDGVRFITTRHEQGAGYMAYGYAKSTGKTGVFTVVPGPGMLNASAAMATAYGANTPVMMITGNIMSHLIGQGRGQLHELPDHLGTMRGFTGWADRINHPTEAPRMVAEGFRQMTGRRIRPTAIEAPWDVFGQSALVELEDVHRAPEPAPQADPRKLVAAAKMIAQARHPLILVGAGANEASAEVQALAEMLQAPVTAHRSGKGILSNDHPLSLLSPEAHEYFAKCDCLIGIGSRLELTHMRWKWQPTGMKTVRIDIDPTEFVRLKPDVGILADAAAGVTGLMKQIEPRLVPRGPRAAELTEYRALAATKMQRIQPQYDYLSAIRNVLPRDGFFVEEISQIGFSARVMFPVYKPREYVTCGYQDNLGFGFHTALGVKVAHPDKPVVAVCGDGGFMFGVQELATAVQYGINLVTVIFNNNAFGNVRRDQNWNYHERRIGADLVNPDFVEMAKSFGAIGVRVDSPDALEKAIADGFEQDGPVIIEVPIETGSERSQWSLIHPAPPVLGSTRPAWMQALGGDLIQKGEMMMGNYSLTIGGAAVTKETTFDVINPATGQAFAQCPQATTDDLNTAVSAAKSAMPAWAALPDEDRIEAIRKLGDLLEVHRDELSKLITREQGKTQSGLGANFELDGCIGWTRTTAALKLDVEPLINNDDELVEVHRKPVGVVASITPWNWPLMIGIWHIMPALRAGCTVVMKPSPFTPLSTLKMVELFNQVLPAGVLNVVTGDAEVGDAISSHPDIAKIVFTGSVPTGRRIMSSAGPTLKRLTLELGGNDAGIVLPGTDMEGKMEGLFWGSFINSGQTCSCLKRLYVHEDDYERTVKLIADYLEDVKMGDGLNEANILGPLSNEMQFDKVKDLVADAKEKGARMVTGGNAIEGGGYFHELTLIADATHDMRVVTEEQFGPVLPVIKYKTVEEALEMSNSVEVGLGASVWGDDLEEAKRVALQMEAGTMWVNRHAVLNPMVPMGGVKQSGFGVEFGQEGLREYTRVQVLSAQK
jgi:acetolactate synthase-1/2/3 large subunit